MLRAPAPHPNDGLCFKCGHPGHRARDCSQNQNQLALPSTGRGNGRNNQPRNNNAKPHARGQAYHVDLNEAQDQPATVMGTLLVNSVPAIVFLIQEHRILSCHKHLHISMTLNVTSCTII